MMAGMEEVTAAEPRWLEPHEQSAWRAYLEMDAKLTASLNRQMQSQFGLSISDFSVLVQLSEHVDARMRVLELARALDWEKSRLSHQLTRMQQRGLISRSYCTEDRRGANIVLTELGRKTVEAAAPGHVETVRTYLFDVLDAAQVDALHSIAQTVIERIDRACAGAVERCVSGDDGGDDGGDDCGATPGADGSV